MPPNGAGRSAFVQHAPKRSDIAARVGVSTENLFGAQIAAMPTTTPTRHADRDGRTSGKWGIRGSNNEDSPRSSTFTVPSAQTITLAGVEVSVNDGAFVSGPERRGQLSPNQQRLVNDQRVVGQSGGKRLTSNPLTRERLRGPSFDDPVDAWKIRMVQRAKETDVALEPGEAMRSGRARRKDSQHRQATADRVACLPHFAESALAEQRLQLIGSEPIPSLEIHPSGSNTTNDAPNPLGVLTRAVERALEDDDDTPSVPLEPQPQSTSRLDAAGFYFDSASTRRVQVHRRARELHCPTDADLTGEEIADVHPSVEADFRVLRRRRDAVTEGRRVVRVGLGNLEVADQILLDAEEGRTAEHHRLQASVLDRKQRPGLYVHGKLFTIRVDGCAHRAPPVEEERMGHRGAKRNRRRMGKPAHAHPDCKRAPHQPAPEMLKAGPDFTS